MQDGWKYKGVVHDVDLLDCDNMQFETGGELINVKMIGLLIQVVNI